MANELAGEHPTRPALSFLAQAQGPARDGDDEWDFLMEKPPLPLAAAAASAKQLQSRCSERRSEFDDASTHGDCDRVGAVADVELREHVLQMGLDRLFRKLECVADLLIRFTLRHQPQHRDFAVA